MRVKIFDYESEKDLEEEVNDFIDADIYCNRKFNEELKSKFKNTEARYFDYFIDGSVKLGQFSAPNDYVTIIK